MAYDLVVRNAYVYERDAVVDVAVDDGTIVAVRENVFDSGHREIDAEGDLVSPGLVDCHVHMDQALTAEGARFPRYNDLPFDKNRCIGESADYFDAVTPEELRETALQVAGMFVANGVLDVRTHAYVDGTVGTKVVEALLDVRERLEGLLDLQVVTFPQRGYVSDPDSKAYARRGLEMGADVVGGIDPASINVDVEAALDAWFDLAVEFDREIDAHVHDGGSLGMHTLSRLAERTIDAGYQGRVTASHAFALADTADAGDDPRAAGTSLAGAIDRFEEAGLKFVTCYPSTRPGHPIKRFQERGIPMGHGNDEVRDIWMTHGNADVLQGALVNSFKLSTDYEYATNPGLAALWRMLTVDSARVLGVEDEYGVVEGTPADLVVWDAASPHWAIITQPARRYVLKEGRVVVEDDTLTDAAIATLTA